MTHLTVMAATALATFAGGAAVVAQSRTPSTAPLGQLSQRDLEETTQSGCECSFMIGRRTLARVIGNELTIRTGGRQVCPISDAQFAALSDGEGQAECGGFSLSLRRTGPVEASPETDSAAWDAELAIAGGRTFEGRWGCAC